MTTDIFTMLDVFDSPFKGKEAWGAPAHCPKCQASMKGLAIKPENRQYSAPGMTHYSRAIGIVDQQTDCVTRWQCPDCGCQWKKKVKN